VVNNQPQIEEDNLSEISSHTAEREVTFSDDEEVPNWLKPDYVPDSN
jgi:hypothetical protein